MSEVLSQDEIDQLLMSINDSYQRHKGKEREERSFFDPPDERVRKIKIYDFKRPDKFSKDNIRTVSMIHEIFARLNTATLTSNLCTAVHVHVASVDQLTYEEFIRSIPTPTTLAIINMDPLKGNAMFEIDPAITLAMIDYLCGGTGEENKENHELTDIEQSIMEGVIVRLLGNLREAWTKIIDLRPRLAQIDTNPQFAQIVPPNEMGVLVTLETKIGEVEGTMNIYIPYITIEPIISRFSIMFLHGTPIKYLRSSGNLTDKGSIPIKLTAELFRQNYPVKEILDWKIGTNLTPMRRTKIGEGGWLRMGGRRVWAFEVMHDCSPKKIKVCGVLTNKDNPYETEGRINMSKVDAPNPLVAGALADAGITVSVELGSTSKTVKEILGMGEGTILELDKLAGEPVDVKANGVLIAKGEVVVIDENFGVRVTELTGSRNQPSSEEDDDEMDMVSLNM